MGGSTASTSMRKRIRQSALATRPCTRSKTDPAANENVKACPPSFVCPLTFEPMYDPVLDADGNTYERIALLQWLQEHRTSPVSRQPLTDRMLVPNIALREAIHEFMGQSWVDEKRQQQEVMKGDEVKSSAAVEQADFNKASPLRAKVDGYLQSAALELCDVELSLNNEGCCAFKYDQVTFVLDVPEQVGIFCFYTQNLLPPGIENTPLWGSIYSRAMEMNFLQVDTRGGCLSVRKHEDGRSELVFSYTDRVREITASDFTNILRSFIETSQSLRSELLP